MFETKNRLQYKVALDIGESKNIILGMGQMGTGTYGALSMKYGKMMLGIDFALIIHAHPTLSETMMERAKVFVVRRPIV